FAGVEDLAFDGNHGHLLRRPPRLARVVAGERDEETDEEDAEEEEQTAAECAEDEDAGARFTRGALTPALSQRERGRSRRGARALSLWERVAGGRVRAARDGTNG